MLLNRYHHLSRPY